MCTQTRPHVTRNRMGNQPATAANVPKMAALATNASPTSPPKPTTVSTLWNETIEIVSLIDEVWQTVVTVDLNGIHWNHPSDRKTPIRYLVQRIAARFRSPVEGLTDWKESETVPTNEQTGGIFYQLEPVCVPHVARRTPWAQWLDHTGIAATPVPWIAAVYTAQRKVTQAAVTERCIPLVIRPFDSWNPHPPTTIIQRHQKCGNKDRASFETHAPHSHRGGSKEAQRGRAVRLAVVIDYR